MYACYVFCKNHIYISNLSSGIFIISTIKEDALTVQARFIKQQLFYNYFINK